MHPKEREKQSRTIPALNYSRSLHIMGWAQHGYYVSSSAARWLLPRCIAGDLKTETCYREFAPRLRFIFGSRVNQMVLTFSDFDISPERSMESLPTRMIKLENSTIRP